MEMEYQKYGQLRVLEYCKEKGKFRCRCVCGEEVYIRKDHLRDGSTKSCGKCNKTKYRITQPMMSWYRIWHRKVKRDCCPEWQDFNLFYVFVKNKELIANKIDDTKLFGPENWRNYDNLIDDIFIRQCLNRPNKDICKELGITPVILNKYMNLLWRNRIEAEALLEYYKDIRASFKDWLEYIHLGIEHVEI